MLFNMPGDSVNRGEKRRRSVKEKGKKKDLKKKKKPSGLEGSLHSLGQKP